MTAAEHGVHVRRATGADATPIASLSGALGYPAAPAEMEERLRRLLAREDQVVLVAEAPDGEIAGWLHGAHLEILEAGPRCEIWGLVVHPAYRRRGVGRGLVAAVEAWAAARGLGLVSVRSNVVRPEAHPFYEGLGYARVKTQHAYRKPLPPGGASANAARTPASELPPTKTSKPPGSAP